MTGNQRHGWLVFAAMAMVFLGGFFFVYYFVGTRQPEFRQVRGHSGGGGDQRAEQAGGNMEGKEVRFGIANSALFATITTDASCGAVNSWHDSYTPLGG
jgi:K+-transporting ATPase ATPase A chain